MVYVWLDALSNYITGIGYDADGDSSDLYKKYWPADLHLIGKDIIRFHTIYWPIFLMALGEPLPKQVFGHPWLLQGGEKMSKSKGNVLYVDDLINIFSLDAVRYFVLHEMPYENDGTITWELMTERVNSDLANTLGNLVNRTIAMTNKYLGGAAVNKGVASQEVKEAGKTGQMLSEKQIDEDLESMIASIYAKVEGKMDELRVADALSEIFNLFKRLNKYIDETEPWVLAKDDGKKDRLSTVLYHLCDGIMTGASLLYPFMPSTAEKIASQLGTGLYGFDDLNGFGNYPEGTRVTQSPEILFARLDKDEIMGKASEVEKAQREEFVSHQKKAFANLVAAGRMTQQECDAKLKELDAVTKGAAGDGADNGLSSEDDIHLEAKDEVTYDDFAKLQFAVGRIIACEEVPKSKKLLCSQVRIGDQTRQILSGIKPHYTPEQMVGRKVMVLLNLAPRKMAGLESQGMLLCAEGPDGELALMTPEKDLPSGSEIA